MPKCLDKCCFHVRLERGCTMVGAYLILRACIALGVLAALVARGAVVVAGSCVLWGAFFGLLIGPRLIYATAKKLSRSIKNTAVWLVIYGIFDLAIFLASRPEWGREVLLWTLGLVVELCLFAYFALVLWSYGSSVASCKPPRREQLRMAVLKEYPLEK